MRIRAFAAAAAILLGTIAAATSVFAEPVKIRLGYGEPPGVASGILFHKKELLKHYGKSYVVDAIYFRGTSAAMQAMAAKELDISYNSFSGLANVLINGGLDLKVISDVSGWASGGHQGPEYVVREDSPIKSLPDLKGKVLATNALGSGFHYAMVAALKKVGLREKADYTVVEVRLPAMEATLREGRVDLATAMAPFLYAMESRGGVRRLFKPEDAMGDVQSLINVGRTEFLRENRAAVVDFLEDYVTALRWFLDPANNKEAVAVAADFMKQPASQLEGWAFTKKDFYRSPTATPNVEALQRNVDTMLDLGVIRRRVAVKDAIDLSYLDEAKKRLGVQ